MFLKQNIQVKPFPDNTSGILPVFILFASVYLIVASFSCDNQTADSRFMFFFKCMAHTCLFSYRFKRKKQVFIIQKFVTVAQDVL